MTLQNALAVLNGSSTPAGNTAEQITINGLTPAQRAAAERAQQEFLRQAANRYVLYFAAGSLGAIVLGALFGRELGAMIGECLEVARSKGK
jgi:hypothetical protein